jgi:integrase/recombinase XerD
LATEIHALQCGDQTVSRTTDTALSQHGQGNAIRRCLINATTDEQAIAYYLQEHARSARTREAYEREVGRFWLWLKQKGIRSLNDVGAEQAAEYREQLQNGLVRTPTAWKVSEPEDRRTAEQCAGRAISAGTVNYALGILRAMCGFLFEVGYLGGNVFKAVRPLPETDVGTAVERYLRYEDWIELRETILAMDRSNSKRRGVYQQTRWVTSLAVIAGLRRNEIATGWMGAFRREGDRWWLYVVGKGDKKRKVPAPDVLMQELVEYRRWLRTLPGMALLPDEPGGENDVPNIPLLSRIDNAREGVDVRRVWEIVKGAVERTAARLESSGQKDRAGVLAMVSTHWLRHTGVTAVANLTDLQTAQAYARHSDVRTTMTYVHSQAESLHEKVSDAMEKSKMFEPSPEAGEQEERRGTGD